MARATWSGYLSFGLVSVPVRLFNATSDQTVHFNQLHKGTSNRVRYKKVDEITGEELATDDIINGFPIAKDEYVVVTREEMREAAPEKTDLIGITDFVNLAEIDAKYFRQSYFLAPNGRGADRAYALLLQAMSETSKVGIATVVLREKEHLVAVRPGDGVLMLETMYFEDEIRKPMEEIDDLPKPERADSRELAIAKQLIESMSATWEPSRYKNSYRDRIEQLVEQKRKGHAVVVDEATRPRSNVIDLMSALEESIARSRGQSATLADEVVDPAPRGRGKAGNRAHEQQAFDGMSKAELLERASELNVEVNPKMTKLQLVEALTDGEPKRRGRKVS